MDNEQGNTPDDRNDHSTPPEIAKTQSMLTQLVVLTILIIGLVLVIAAYPRLRPRFSAQAQVTIPTQHPSATASPIPAATETPTPTNTLRASLTPTITLTPTPSTTPSETVTPPGPPTITPARPFPDNALYSLAEWTPEKADLVVQYMEDYPNFLTETARGGDNAGYWAAFDYAVIALKEALLRFPDAEQASDWRWKLAYNLARTGNPEAGEIYAQLIAAGLNQGDTVLEELPEWFNFHEQNFNLYTIELKPPAGVGAPQGFYSSHLLQIDGKGSALLWLVEGPGSFSAFPLVVDFNFATPSSTRTLLSDLTGDNFDELVVYPSESEKSFEMIPPRIFNLAEVPPRELGYQLGDDHFYMGIEFLNRWIIDENGRLVFEGQAYPACPVTVRIVYNWRNNLFERGEISYQVDPASVGEGNTSADEGNLHQCRAIVNHAANTWGPQAAIPLMETLMPGWPPELSLDGKKLTEEETALEKDEWRYRLGIYHALAGNDGAAIGYLKELAARPSIPGSQWANEAQNFLSKYNTPEDIYQACLGSSFCGPSKALSFLGSRLPDSSVIHPIGYLTEKGMQLISSGYEDFDRDGTSEQWFTTRHRPLEPIELWVIASKPGAAPAGKPQLIAFLIGQVTSNQPKWQIIEEDPENVIVRLEGNRQFTMKRQPETLHPIISWLPPAELMPNRFIRELTQAETALLSGEDAGEIQKKLIYLADFPGLLCLGTWSCDRYNYFLGLASELAGDSKQAVAAYLTLWRDYLRSPFTTMARLKLVGEASALVTPLPPSATPTITLAPGEQLTPQPTTTPSQPYPYPEPPYPYP
jgi:hypothetical protein